MRRNYLHLWLLLSAALVAVIALSAFSPVTIGSYELRDSGIAQTLSPQKNLPTEFSANSKTSEASETPSNPTPPAPDPDYSPENKTILFIGDSMLDGLYPRLAAYARHNGHTLYAVIWYSSTSEIWGRSGKLKHYIGRLNPDYVFICLGANELFVRDIAAKRGRYVSTLISEIGNIPYLWIGPPNWRPDTGINSLIASNTAAGSFFLSDGMSFERGKDGAHPTRQSAAEWMDSIIRWMPANSAHPIRFDLPPQRYDRAHRVFVHTPDDK